jgi:hypothetical protein
MLNLPQELLFDIIARLPFDGILALKLAHPTFNSRLPLDPRSWPKSKISECARLAVCTYLAPPLPAPTHERCILCNALYQKEMFRSSSSPMITRRHPIRQNPEVEVLELPSRMCCWHLGRLIRLERSERDGRKEWVSRPELLCIHCGVIQSWGLCNCHCDSCTFRTVHTYTRFLDKETKLKSFTFWRSTEGNVGNARQGGLSGLLYVRELHCDPGEFNSLLGRYNHELTAAQMFPVRSMR